ncbi:MAG: 3'-5' exonuclease [Bacteroidota bacterium]
MLPFADRLNITPEEILTLPYGGFTGNIQLIDTREGIRKAVEEIAAQDMLGFDTETRPSFKKGEFHHVALLQLATREQAWLFRLNRIGLDAELVRILSESIIAKCGVAIRDDLKGLQKLEPFAPGGFIELATVSKEAGLQVEGLRKLAAILLGIRISKSSQTTNWESRVLTDKQIEYAATDAWASLEIYNRLIERKKSVAQPG